MTKNAVAEAPHRALRSNSGSQRRDGAVAGLQVFILGPARSGTSITYHAMREVFDLEGRGEGHVFPIFQRLIHEYYGYVLEFSKSSGVLANQLDTASFREHMYRFLRTFYLNAYPAGSWVDKTPGSEALVGAELILAAFPTAKILATRRTGVEVVQSFRQKFARSFEDACRVWADCMRASQMVHERGFPILDLDQFDLTNHPGDAAARIAAFLGRPDREGALAQFFQERRVEKSSSHDWRRRLTLADVDWTDEERALFVDICGDWMRRLDYPM